MKYWVIDTETTGLQVGYHELTEVSIIRCEDLVQKNWFLGIKHPKRCDAFALKITNKTVDELTSRKLFIEDVIDEMDEFIRSDGEEPDTRVGIAHNAPFDRRVLEYYWKSFNKQFPINYWLNTVPMSKKYVRSIMKLHEHKGFSLDVLLDTVNLKSFEKQNIHSAEVDARNLFRLWNHMTKQGKLSNSEFITLSPDIDTAIIKKSKKQKITANNMDDFMEDIIDDIF